MGVIEQKYRKYQGPNPYKGFVPFIGKYDFESSMEFFYFPLSEILISKHVFSWVNFEKKLKEIYLRNHTAIVRIYIDYPSLEIGLPLYLKELIELIKYDEFGGGFHFDYKNDLLIEELIRFINKFGKKYDGDNRIAFIECGLIGHWGEWHCFPNNDLMSTENQLESIIKAYVTSFKHTKILTRYPKYKFLKKYNVGFHDDSFCYSTMPTKYYHFVSQLRKNDLGNHYLKNPIGGEVRPEEQFNLIFGKNMKESYDECIKATHCSWLINQSAFTENCNTDYIKFLSSQLGYDFYLDNISFHDNKISFDLCNIGIALIYYNFFCFLIIECHGKITKVKLKYDLTCLFPHSKHYFEYGISNMTAITSIKFSLERESQKIILSNQYMDNNYVLLFEQ